MMQVPEASPERILEIAQFAAKRAGPVSFEEVRAVLDSTEGYASRVTRAAAVLGFLSAGELGRFHYCGPAEILDSTAQEWPSVFRCQLQGFPPFLYFVYWLRVGDSAERAVRKTCVEYELTSRPESVCSRRCTPGASTPKSLEDRRLLRKWCPQMCHRSTEVSWSAWSPL